MAGLDRIKTEVCNNGADDWNTEIIKVLTHVTYPQGIIKVLVLDKVIGVLVSGIDRIKTGVCNNGADGWNTEIIKVLTHASYPQGIIKIWI